jgi:hypothetical protein
MALAVGGVIAAASVVQLLARLSGHCGGFLFWLSLFVLTLALIGAGAFKCAASHPHTAALLVCVRVLLVTSAPLRQWPAVDCRALESQGSRL